MTVWPKHKIRNLEWGTFEGNGNVWERNVSKSVFPFGRLALFRKLVSFASWRTNSLRKDFSFGLLHWGWSTRYLMVASSPELLNISRINLLSQAMMKLSLTQCTSIFFDSFLGSLAQGCYVCQYVRPYVLVAFYTNEFFDQTI